MQQFPPSRLLTLTGLPRQRGQIHGESLRREIHELIRRWQETLARSSAISPAKYIREMVKQTNFTAASEKWTPRLLEEVRGIAEGSGENFNDIFAFQLQDEEWWFGQEKGLNQPNASRQDSAGRHSSAGRHCSALGWRGDGKQPNLIAQNMDMPDYMQDYQVVMRIRDERSESEILVFSVAGLIALNGMNNSPLGIVCNNLGQLNHSRDGLPVAYVLRGVLEQKTIGQAQSFLTSIPHASGQNYILGSPMQIIDLECSANQVMEYSPDGRSRSVCHTNHPLVNRDYPNQRLDLGVPSEETQAQKDEKTINSRTRYQLLSIHLGAVEWLNIDPETARRLLSSHGSQEHPICRHPDTNEKWSTLGTSIMQFGHPAYLFVCPGSPCSAKFSEFPLHS